MTAAAENVAHCRATTHTETLSNSIMTPSDDNGAVERERGIMVAAEDGDVDDDSDGDDDHY